MKEYYAEQERMIREDWFGEHEVKILAQEDKLTHIRWGKPGTSVYAAYYVVLHKHGTLMVYGDIGEAVYRWGDTINLHFLAGCSLEYFAGKCQASERGRGYKSWNSDKAKWFLDDFIKEEVEPISEDVIHEASEAVHYQESWQNFLGTDEAESLLGRDAWEYADIGMEPDLRCVGHLIGLRMIHERTNGS
jgi:hypothetical protein